MNENDEPKTAEVHDLQQNLGSAGPISVNLPEGLENMVLSPEFGDYPSLWNSRKWLQEVCEAKGAKFTGGGCGMGQADIDIILDGCHFNVSIRPIIRNQP